MSWIEENVEIEPWQRLGVRRIGIDPRRCEGHSPRPGLLMTKPMVWRADYVRVVSPRNVWRCDSAAELGRRDGHRKTMGSRPA